MYVKKTVKTAAKNIISVFLSLVLLVSFLVSCSGTGETLMTHEDKTLSVSTYEFLLTRMKGTLASYGYDVSDDDFWNSIISSDGMTYDDYFRTTMLKQACYYLIAEVLFDEEGLTLSDEKIAEIDKKMDKLVENAGSKFKLNSELSMCGVNYNMLREIYITEAKVAALKEHFYGKDGEKIDSEIKEEFLNANYVSFKQVFLAGYAYETETDAKGDTVFYTDEKATAIAYDKEKGSPKPDEFGGYAEDKLGGTVYYLEDGRIAYDTENGYVKYILDDKGEKKVKYYGKEELEKLSEKADALIEDRKYTEEEFEALVSEYSESESDEGRLYLFNSVGYYGNQSASAEYLDDIAKELGDMEVGEVAVVPSDFGYHIVRKYENEEKAYENKEYKDVFANFTSDLITELFSLVCEACEDEVDLDTACLDDAPKMKDVVSNILY